MNFTKTALVLAMAGIVSVPMAAQASVADGAYASIRIGLEMTETNGGFGANQGGIAGTGSEDTTIGGHSSRWGYKSTADLGNGMSGFGRVEFGLNTETNAQSARLAFVGVKGDFGSVSVGRQYNTFYNHVVAPNDMPNKGSGFSMVRYGSRSASTLNYAGSAGPVSFGLTLQMDNSSKTTTGDEEAMDALELGASFDAGFATVGIALRDEKADKSGTAVDPDEVVGLSLSGIAAGPVTIGLGFQTQDTVGTTRTNSSFLIDLSYNNLYAHFESEEFENVGDVNDQTMFSVGYNMSFGPQTSGYIEYVNVDTEQLVGDSGDQTSFFAVLKYAI